MGKLAAYKKRHRHSTQLCEARAEWGATHRSLQKAAEDLSRECEQCCVYAETPERSVELCADNSRASLQTGLAEFFL